MYPLCRLQNSHNLVWPSVADIMSEMVCRTGNICDNTNPHTHKHVFHIVEIDSTSCLDKFDESACVSWEIVEAS